MRGLGQFNRTPYVATDEKATRKFPLLLTTGRVLSQYNVGAQTRRTANNIWHTEDILDLHESDAQLRGVADGSWVKLSSRVGETIMRARITDEVPAGVVYTTFHFPESGANVITTAVEITPSAQGPGSMVETHIDGDVQLASIIRMVNQIAANFPVTDAPEVKVAHHIVQFWTPVMIERLHKDVDKSLLSPIAQKALEVMLVAK
jgi:formate dehydrogenase major subunit